jgi:poly-gamma-glutamate synthesis protein (capsule biosynthesis protein)
MTTKPFRPETITLALAGDVMLGRLVNETIRARGFAHPWGDILPAMKDSDALLVNLECALTSHTGQWTDGEDKAFYFRADPAAVRTLQIADVDFVSLANNHAGDFETEGLLETVSVLDHAGIAHAGAGRSLAEAERPAILDVTGYQVGILAFADYPVAWAARPWRAGINYTKVSTHPRHLHRIEDGIRSARTLCDLVIFSIHWGPNMQSRPNSEFKEFARAVVDAGADVFWGHSAHVVQGVEIWNGRPIIYDTGDFVDDYAVDPYLRNDLSSLFLLCVRPPDVDRIDLIPVKIDDMQVNMAHDDERKWFAERFVRLCSEMGTEVDHDGKLTIRVREGTRRQSSPSRQAARS